MWLTYATYCYTVIIAVWIVTRRQPREALLPIILAGLVGIPVFIFGRSASGGGFAADIAIAAFLARFGFSFGPQIVRRAGRNGVLVVFTALAAWATASSIIACSDEPRVATYAVYGVARWWMFLVMVAVFFGQGFSEQEFIKNVRRLAMIMIAYGALCIAHQQGLVDLSGWESLGPRAVESAERQQAAHAYETPFGRRIFLGVTSAGVAGVCCVGFWIAAILWVQSARRPRLLAVILIIVMLWAMAGTGSRSDMIGLILSLLATGVLFAHVMRPHTRGTLVLLLVAFIILAALVTWGDLEVLQTPTLKRHATAFFQYGPNAEGTGGHRYREHVAMLSYLKQNPYILALGLGANGYRRLAWEQAATMGFGHNVYLHTVCELGLLGLVLLAVWLWCATRMGVPASSPIRSASMSRRQEVAIVVLAMVMQRLFAGWGADTLFAVDGMLSPNVLFLGLLGISFSTYGHSPGVHPDISSRRRSRWRPSQAMLTQER